MAKKEYYTVSEIAKKFSVSRQTVYNWIKRKELKSVRFANVVRIHYTELEKMGILEKKGD